MTATLKPALPDGAILTQHIEEDFANLANGRPVGQRVVIGVVQAGAGNIKVLERGRVNHVAYESVHFVEVTDAHEADNVRHLITQVRAARGLSAHQPMLFGASDEEQRTGLRHMIAEWASEHGHDETEVDRQWVALFGDGYAASETPLHGSLQHLREFAYTVGVISDSPVVEDVSAEEEEAGNAAEPDVGDDPDAEPFDDGSEPPSPGFGSGPSFDKPAKGVK